MHKYGGLLRASVASATNDHRLGANEAPPAIISIFLGDQLADVFAQIASGGATSSKEKGSLEIGVDTLPVLPTDPGDRNRTSPFAFTGNRFEFRAPGSLQSIAGPMATINTILAEALDYIATELEAARRRGSPSTPPSRRCSRPSSPSTARWSSTTTATPTPGRSRRPQRGLPNLKTTLDALPELITEESMELFSRYGVFNHREMHSRYEIALEQYILSIGVEAALTLEIAKTIILPAVLRYQTELAHNVASLTAIGIDADPATLLEVSAHARLPCGPGSWPCASPSRRCPRATEEELARHALKSRSRPWLGCGRPPTPWRARWRTTSGRWPPTRRCSSSSRHQGGPRRAVEGHRVPTGEEEGAAPSRPTVDRARRERIAPLPAGPRHRVRTQGRGVPHGRTAPPERDEGGRHRRRPERSLRPRPRGLGDPPPPAQRLPRGRPPRGRPRGRPGGDLLRGRRDPHARDGAARPRAAPEVRLVVQLANPSVASALERVSGKGSVLDVADLAGPSFVEACLRRNSHTIDLAGTRFEVVEVTVTEQMSEGSSFRGAFGDLAPVAIMPGDGSELIACPGRDQLVGAGDRVAVLGTHEDLARGRHLDEGRRRGARREGLARHPPGVGARPAWSTPTTER